MSASVPGPQAEPRAPGDKPAYLPRRFRRWTNTATALLLCVAVGLVLASASPSILRAAGLPAPGQDAADRPPAGRFALPPPGQIGASDSRPRFQFAPDDDDDDPHMTDLEREYPDGMWPGRRSDDERKRDRELFPGGRDPMAEPDRPPPRVREPSPGAGEGRAQFGVARRRIELIEKPIEGGRRLGEIKPGQMVMVIKEAGDYALVAHSGEDGVLMGWAKKSEIAVR